MNTSPHTGSILVVDDNPADIVLIREALKDAACSIEVAADGPAALRRLASPGASQIRMVFADLNLPAIGGFDVAAVVRKTAGLRHVPIVLLSSSARPEEIERAYESANCCFVQKPGDLDPFLRAIRISYEFWCTVATLPRKPV